MLGALSMLAQEVYFRLTIKIEVCIIRTNVIEHML